MSVGRREDGEGSAEKQGGSLTASRQASDPTGKTGKRQPTLPLRLLPWGLSPRLSISPGHPPTRQRTAPAAPPLIPSVRCRHHTARHLLQKRAPNRASRPPSACKKEQPAREVSKGIALGGDLHAEWGGWQAAADHTHVCHGKRKLKERKEKKREINNNNNKKKRTDQKKCRCTLHSAGRSDDGPKIHKKAWARAGAGMGEPLMGLASLCCSAWSCCSRT